MPSLVNPAKNASYTKITFFMFFIRTVMLGSALYYGPYFEIYGTTRSFKIFAVFLDITSIFQFIFMFDVIQRKNLFQFLLYIPLLLYALILTITLIVEAYGILDLYSRSQDIYISIGFLYAYGGILVLEAVIHFIMYSRLRNDFMWSNFKKIGVNPIINEAFKRREEFYAIRRLAMMFLSGEIASFNINLRDYVFNFFFILGTLTIVYIVTSVFPTEEYVIQRRFFLVFAVICIVGGFAYTILEIVLYFTEPGRRGGLILESSFYTIIMTILLIGGFRDYQMFGNGLKEYYSGTIGLGKRLTVMK